MSYSTLTLKRGMTTDFGLWRWFDQTTADPSLRADVEVVLLAEDRQASRARFRLSRAVPIKMRAPMLSARDGAVAVEELQVSYEQLTLVEVQS